MPLVSSPHLVDHAIGRVFSSFGQTSVTRLRNMLKVIREEFGGNMPATWVLQRCGSDATLLSTYEKMSLNELWTVIDEKEEEERNSLSASFAKCFPR